ncbi:aminopeptidase [Parabacteroides sp. OttesenSCG-928-N08]|nr:aminopeptidase [Parabacteroides sp. OttesenSCG-928-N08]
MRKLSHLILLWLLLVITTGADAQSWIEQLEALPGVTAVEPLESDVFPEKGLVRLKQYINPKDTTVGSFTQRVIVCHAGFDRPTVLVTEGYGAAYALRPRYTEELARLFQTNIIVVEHRYFLESTPAPLNWDYLTAENSAEDLHRVTQTFKALYPNKWVSTGVSKGGQTVMIYRSFFPEDVDFSVPYVAPLCRAVEDGRHEPFLASEVGREEERDSLLAYQKELLKRRATMVPLLEEYSQEKYSYRIPLDEVFDYCVLEYPFAFWQRGHDIHTLPPLDAEDRLLFDHLMTISSPDYFSIEQSIAPFFVQAARELGYYGYDITPYEGLLEVTDTRGYLHRIMLPDSAGDIAWSPALYQRISSFLQDNDPKMLFIYGEIDPWSAPRVPDLEGKSNYHIFMQPRGSHAACINAMPEELKQQIMEILTAWFEE